MMYCMPFRMYPLILQQEILCTLYLTKDHVTQSMEAKIMKYHVLLWSFGKILPEDQD